MPETPAFVPELAARLPLIEDLPARSLNPAPDEEARREAFGAALGPANLPEQITVASMPISGPRGPIPVRIYTRDGAAHQRPALVWYHGGSFIGGSVDMPEADHVSRILADRADAVVVSVDYRLASETVSFPVPHDDCWAAYTWVRGHAEELGADPDRVAVGGASAGGNLAAGVGLRSRDEGIPAWQVLLAYPVVHPVLPPASAQVRRALDVTPPTLRFYPEAIAWMTHIYMGSGTPTPYAFPGLATDLTGYPPTFIDNDEFDDLRASGEAFAAQLTEDGVDVTVTVARGVSHGHLNMVGLPEASASLDRFAARLRHR